MFNINGKKASSFKAKMLDREISSNEIITIDDWLDGATQPTFIRQQEKFKSIKLVVLIEGSSEQDAYTQFSKLTAELKFGLLKFDDMDLTFKVMINGAISPKRLKKNVFQVEYTLKSAYGMASEASISRQGGSPNSFTLMNNGTAETPCIIEITPSQRIGSITFNGFSDKPFTIRSLESGQKVVINGEDCSIKVEGKDNFKNFDGWGFPTLIPGENKLSVDSSLGYTMVVKYKPRYI